METTTLDSPSMASTEPVVYAGFWLRFVAIIIDGLIIGAVYGIVIMPVLSLLGFGAFSSFNYNQSMSQEEIAGMASLFSGSFVIIQIFSIALYWLYFALMESSTKQATIGKLALGLKVTDINGQKLSFGHATGRYFSKLISNLTFFIGYIMAGFTEKKQALHDIIAGTLVVKK